MDALETVQAMRAMGNLKSLIGDGPTPHMKARAFVEIARGFLANQNDQIALAALSAHGSDRVRKAAAAALDADELWRGPEAQALASAYIASIAEGSLFDQIKRYARTLPPNMRHGMIAAGAVGDVATEGVPKPVIDLGFNVGEVEPLKAVGIVAMSAELARATGETGRLLFERELGGAITRAMNASVLSQFVDTNTPTVAAGGDPLEGLRAGLLEAGPSLGYVVAVGTGEAAWLATHESNRGAGVRGGEFAPGVHIVAIDGMSGMTIIPASRVALFDGGLRLASSGEASLDLRDSPESPAQTVSMFQTNSRAILVERTWHVLTGGTEAVRVEGA